MYLDHLLYIVEVAQTGSISLAAERLHVSQPNISKAITTLEKELGVKLFKRSRTGTFPTESGQAIIEKAKEIISGYEELKKQANLHATMLNGRLSIATIPSLSMSLLPKTLSVFTKRFPGVEVELIEDNSSKVIKSVEKSEVDLGLIGVLDQSPSPKINTVSFMKTKIMACVGKHSPLAHKKSVTFSEIIKYPILSNSPIVIQTLLKYGEPKFLFKSKNIEGAKRVIAEGLAIGFYTDIAIRFDAYVHNGEIIPLHIENENLEISLCWIHPKNNLSLITTQFINELKDQVNQFKRLYGFY